MSIFKVKKEPYQDIINLIEQMDGNYLKQKQVNIYKEFLEEKISPKDFLKINQNLKRTHESFKLKDNSNTYKNNNFEKYSLYSNEELTKIFKNGKLKTATTKMLNIQNKIQDIMDKRFCFLDSIVNKIPNICNNEKILLKDYKENNMSNLILDYKGEYFYYIIQNEREKHKKISFCINIDNYIKELDRYYSIILINEKIICNQTDNNFNFKSNIFNKDDITVLNKNIDKIENIAKLKVTSNLINILENLDYSKNGKTIEDNYLEIKNAYQMFKKGKINDFKSNIWGNEYIECLFLNQTCIECTEMMLEIQEKRWRWNLANKENKENTSLEKTERIYDRIENHNSKLNFIINQKEDIKIDDYRLELKRYLLETQKDEEEHYYDEKDASNIIMLIEKMNHNYNALTQASKYENMSDNNYEEEIENEDLYTSKELKMIFGNSKIRRITEKMIQINNVLYEKIYDFDSKLEKKSSIDKSIYENVENLYKQHLTRLAGEKTRREEFSEFKEINAVPVNYISNNGSFFPVYKKTVSKLLDTYEKSIDKYEIYLDDYIKLNKNILNEDFNSKIF